MVIKIIPNDHGSPTGKLADAEILFTDGELAGMRLLGFAVWQRRSGTGKNVTFPARTYMVNGDRRMFALLRHNGNIADQERVQQLVIDAYKAYADQAAADAIDQVIPPARVTSPVTTPAHNATAADAL